MLVPRRREPVRPSPVKWQGRRRPPAYRPRPESLEERRLLTFLPPVAYTPAAAAVSGMAVADFNGDGHADIVTADAAAGTVSVLLNRGDNTFQAGPSSPAGGNPVAVAAGDFNGDGKADVAVANDLLAGTVSILLGNGDGTFQAPVSYAVGSMPVDLKTADMNGDGRADLVSADFNFDAETTLLSDGDGTFTAGPSDFVSNPPASVAIGDFNGDGKPDLVAATVTPGNFGPSPSLNIVPGNGDGTYQPRQTIIATGAGLTSVVTGDLNGDGNADIAYVDSAGVHQLAGLGNGTFGGDVLVFRSASGVVAPQSVAIGDLNGDGIPDLAVRAATGFSGTTSTMEILLGRGGGTYWPATPVPMTPGGGPAILADLNGDGAPDILATAGSPASGVAVMMNAHDDAANLAGAVGFRVTALGDDAAGTPFSFAVTAVDAAGNPVPGYRGPVYLGSSDPRMTTSAAAFTLPAPALEYTFTAADAGTHVFANAMTLFAVGRQTIFASAPMMAASSGTVTVGPGPAARLTFTTLGPPVVAGVPTTVVITALDAFGNVATGYRGTVFEGADGFNTLPQDTTFTAADAGVHKVTATFFHAGSDEVAGNDTLNQSIAGSSFINVAAAAMASASITTNFQPLGLPNTGLAGSQSLYTIKAFDAFGNPTAVDPRGFTVTTSDPRATPAVFSASEFGVTWITAGPQSVTITGVADPSITATLSGIGVEPAAAIRFVTSGLAPTTPAGTPVPVTVTAFDPFGNLATGFTGTVSLISSDPRALLPAPYAFTAFDLGSHTFQVTFAGLGPQVVTALPTAVAGFSAPSDLTTVVPGAVAKFAVSGFPTTAAGLAQGFTVTALDAAGNVVTGYTGTVNFSSSDVQAGLPASYTFTAADAGIHSFGAVLKTAGTQSITVTDVANPAVGGTESGITVVAGLATHFVITGPTNPAAGKSFILQITALDAFGNVATGYRGKVQFTDSAGNSGLPSGFTFSAANAGVVSVSVTLNTVGAQTLTLSDAATPTINGGIALTVGPKPSGGGGGGGGGGKPA